MGFSAVLGFDGSCGVGLQMPQRRENVSWTLCDRVG